MLTLAAVAAIAFAAATVPPLPSEAALLAAWHGGSPVLPLWAAATVGNTGGALLMMALGAGALRWRWLSLRMAAPCEPIPALGAAFWGAEFGARLGAGARRCPAPIGRPDGRALAPRRALAGLGQGGRYAVVLATAERLAGT